MWIPEQRLPIVSSLCYFHFVCHEEYCEKKEERRRTHTYFVTAGGGLRRPFALFSGKNFRRPFKAKLLVLGLGVRLLRELT